VKRKLGRKNIKEKEIEYKVVNEVKKHEDDVKTNDPDAKKGVVAIEIKIQNETNDIKGDADVVVEKPADKFCEDKFTMGAQKERPNGVGPPAFQGEMREEDVRENGKRREEEVMENGNVNQTGPTEAQRHPFQAAVSC